MSLSAGVFRGKLPVEDDVPALQSETAEGVFNAGKSLKDQGRYLEAAELFHCVLAKDPGSADAAYMLGNTLKELGAFEDALVAFDLAIKLSPSSPDAHNNRGVVLRYLDRVQEAEAAYRSALDADPSHAEAHLNLAFCHLLRGNYPDGWREYEWRWDVATFPNRGRVHSAPRWDGVRSAATVLVRSEQGYGDMLQFARFLPLVAERSGRVILQSPPGLAGLLRSVPGVSEVVRTDGPPPSFDAEISLGSLPSVLGCTLEKIPKDIPYIFADPGLVASWAGRVDAGFRAGLFWRGRTDTRAYARRSCPLSALGPILEIDGIRWYSLQKDGDREEIERNGSPVLVCQSGQLDFADTAALVSHLDVVVTVDSAVAHLAGAMGKPVLLLVPETPDWRWMLQREDSPWYPTMRLYRQNRADDWAGPVGRIAETLRGMFRNHSRRTSPELLGTRIRGLQKDPGAHLIADGNAAQAAGDYEAAERHFRQAAESGSAGLVALYNLGNVLAIRGRYQEAAECYERARFLDPDRADLLHNYGVVLNRLGRHEEAVSALGRAVTLAPDSAEYLVSLGNARASACDSPGAIECYRKALSINPGSARTHYNMAEEYLRQYRFEEAVSGYRNAIALDRSFTAAYHNLGYALLCSGAADEAVRVYEAGLKISPSDGELRWNLAQALLLEGDYARGWQLYEGRWSTHQFSTRGSAIDLPRWDGTPLNGRSLLVESEQGFGDTIQFVRYAALLAEKGARVGVSCPTPLVRLLREASGVNEAVDAGHRPKGYDLRVPMMSLPHLLRTTLETIPSVVPYLDVPPLLANSWEQRVRSAAGGIRVGVVWGGRATKWDERMRALPPRALLPLSRVAGVTLYCLQPGEAAREVHDLAREIPIVDLTAGIHDFMDTAALILSLDLVISVDTAVAHLAGALGKPVWTLLPFAADWRWLRGRDDSPWYPTMTLFRQQKPGEWGEVLETVAVRLEGLVHGNASGTVAAGGGHKRSHIALQPEQQALLAESIRVQSSGDMTAVLCFYTTAIERGIMSGALFTNLAVLLGTMRRDQDSETCLRLALEDDPESTPALNNLGMVLLARGRHSEARRMFQKALRRHPRNAAVLNNIGITLEGSREGGVELASFRSAVRADGALVDAHWNLSQAALSCGLYDEGWSEYEWRWQKEDFPSPRREYGVPYWDGRPTPGLRLLVHAEQGFGDTIQFARFVPVLRSMGLRVSFEVQRELLTLMQDSFGVDGIYARGDALPPTDAHVPLLSLPRLLGTTLPTIPMDLPYLAPAAPDARIGRMFSGGPARPLKVGICWQGRRSHRHDLRRSLPLTAWAPLLGVRGVEWFSLQVGDAATDLRTAGIGGRVRDISTLLADFSVTAAVIKNLDLVISVDTAVAHLAGALASEVWLILPEPADWRWMRGRADSPWYPTMRLFRQLRAGEWYSVVAALTDALAEVISKREIGNEQRPR